MSDGSLASNERELVGQIKYFFQDFKITEYDIKTPTSKTVVEFYKEFLTEFYIDVPSLMQVQMNQMMVGEHMDMYCDMIPLINLTKAIKSFSIPALKNFCIFDLINPTPKRTFNHIANIMLFIHFSDTRVNSLNPKLERINELELRKEQMLQNIDMMKQECNARDIDIANRKEEIGDQAAEMENLQVLLENMNSEKKSLTENSNKLKSLVQNLKSTCEDRSREYQMLNNDVKELGRQIKENMTNFEKSDFVTLSTEILKEKAKDSAERHERMKKELTEKQELFEQEGNKHDALLKRIESLKEIVKYIDTKLSTDEMCSKISIKIKQKIEEIEKMKNSFKSVVSEINSKSEGLTGLRLQWSKQESFLKESHCCAEREWEQQVEINSQKESKAEEVNLEIIELERLVEINELKYDQFIDECDKLIIESEEEYQRAKSAFAEFVNI